MNTDERAIAQMSREAEAAEYEAFQEWIEAQQTPWGEGAMAPTPEEVAADVCMCEHECQHHEPACPLYAPPIDPLID